MKSVSAVVKILNKFLPFKTLWYSIYMAIKEYKKENYPEGTSRKDVLDDVIDHDEIRLIVLKQFNYMRINGINLVQDADDLVNLYLKISKDFSA